MSESETYSQEWVAIQRLEITNFAGKTVDLSPFFLSIDIQEDIFMPMCSGTITLIDSENFYENFPIIGEELITITYKDFYSEPITRTFATYGVDARERSSERGTGYMLNFCSVELLSNRENSYSKSYNNLEPHVIFTEAFNRLSPTKPVNIEPTVGLQNFVVPMLYPLEVCAQMAARAISSAGYTGSYVFFEDNTQFNFVSLESLISKAPLKYIVGDASVAAVANPKFIFKNYKFQKPVDNIKNKMSGGQGVETKSLDLLNRKMEDKSYDHYGGDYSKVNRVNTSNPDLKTTSSTYKQTSNKGLRKLVIKGADEDFKSTKNDTVSVRYNILSSYVNGPKIHAELPFNATLSVGMMVDVEIPKIDASVQSDIPGNDKYTQGKYIVMACRQIISPDHGETIVEFAKDTYTESHG